MTALPPSGDLYRHPNWLCPPWMNPFCVVMLGIAGVPVLFPAPEEACVLWSGLSPRWLGWFYAGLRLRA